MVPAMTCSGLSKESLVNRLAPWLVPFKKQINQMKFELFWNRVVIIDGKPLIDFCANV
jgi:hypothetical protein